MSKLKYGVYNGRTIKRILENSRLYFLTAFFYNRNNNRSCFH